MADDLELTDSRVEFMALYLLKTLKVKSDKWTKMYALDENKVIIQEFLDKGDNNLLVFNLNPSGILSVAYTYPSQIKAKVCYFAKKSKDPIGKDVNIRDALMYGDLSYAPLDQLSAILDELLMPIFSNAQNQNDWPKVISDDLLRHINNLKNKTYVISGQMKGKTQLPIPAGAEKIDDNELQAAQKGETVDTTLIHAIESVVIDWSHQVQEVLKKDSSQPLLDGLNPGPLVEVEFWKAKAQNLENIFDQLKDPKARKMAELLEITNSSYFPAFQELFTETVNALEEAQDIDIHLKPLSGYFESVETTEFDELDPLFCPMFHTICLVWANSKFYCRPTRIVVLLQELNNSVMKRANEFLEPISLFSGEIEESMEKIKTTYNVLQAYQNAYNEYKAKVKTYFKNGNPAVEWEFTPKLVFARWDKFMERMHMIRELFKTATDLLRLEKVEIGGVKGKALSTHVVKIFEEFKEEFEKFGNKKYDPLDPKSEEFPDDYNQFNAFVLDLDRRLSAVIIQAFDDCNSLNSIFKLITILGTLLERPTIKRDFEPKYSIVLKLLDSEMDSTKKLFDQQNKRKQENKQIQLHRNMPDVSGALKWCQELRERINKPMANFEKLIEHPIKNSDEMARTKKKYDELIQLLNDFMVVPFKDWTAHVGKLSNNNLEKNLLVRDPKTRAIKTNFDPQLIAVIKEVKYLELLKDKDVPDDAKKIFTQNDEFTKYITNLDYTVDSYNKIFKIATEEEMSLIKDELKKIDEDIEKAEKSLKWNSSNIGEYIESIRKKVSDLETRLQKSKLNVEQIQKIMSTWKDIPLFKRYEAKSTLLQLDDRAQSLNKRYKEIDESGKKIHDLVNENKQLFKEDNDSSDKWKNYIQYVDKMVVDGFHKIISCSLTFFLKETDHIKSTPEPLFEAQLQLKPPEMAFIPSMQYGDADGFYELLEELVGSIYRQASLIKRLAKHLGQENYQAELESKGDLSDMRQELMDRVNSIMTKANEYKDSFNKYAYLWVDDRKEFMRQFLLYNHVLTPEEIEAHAETGVPESPPTLNQFKEQVDTYENIYEDVLKLEDIKIVDKWFRVDSKPFKQSLLNTVKKWSYMFKQHLMDDVTNSLKELDEFIKVKDVHLAKEVKEGEYQLLVDMMGHLGDVREKTTAYDNMFDPIKNKIELLKTYGQEVPDDVYEKLQHLPEKWNNTKKLAMQAKQQVAPLQTNEVANIRRKTASFDVEQYNFRERFRQEAPFKYDSDKPYEKLDSNHVKVLEMEKQMTKLDESAQLFEVQVPDFKQIKQCRKEVKLLKGLWDYVFIVRSTFDDWKSTKWREINADSMDAECKKFAKEIRALDKEMRAWDAYTGVENDVKNMMTSLRAVTELQNPAIRDRHWQELMKATGVRFTMNDSTTFADLLALNLHKFEDDVKSIVDKAVKESAMEKVLRELDTTWTTMQFNIEPHTRTKIPLLQASDELIETLEDNQVQLQNMLSSKYIAHFSTEVSDWQKKLSQADQVIQILLEVQRTWSHLESIFIGSEDIRNQLPEDSKRFDTIDKDFKEICSQNEKELNVVKCTNREGLYERLENIQGRLSLCEKALAEYLETKRLAFPRFYFVSSADLLDILSNGNEPEKVMRHLTKLFDSMAKLKLTKDDKGNVQKNATAMWAKDEEYVEFPSACDLSGQVEVWLNRLLDKQCKTVLHWLTEAVQAYEEKSREQWILEFPGQIALTGSQIWWTTEVNIAFAKLEEGFENALKDYSKKQVSQLNSLITMLLTDLSRGDRQKIMTICTIDVHARDVVTKMIVNKTESASEFLWQCQLRHRWDDEKRDCFGNICDAQFKYAHEYLGNQPRLVITPLTDRCYITLTQSLHLIMGGAPAGPAGTGKTETTKDLGRSLGVMVYVFNCSEQMDYKSCGNIYKGLSQTGAWGCFDEFNRISVEVLSVVAVQVKTIQDAIKEKKKRFVFMGEEISLNPVVGIFITMNPGYAGRTELPENLKALFRPCAMVVPDFDLISEIMMVAEGFTEAKLLARKFITLYTLCRELLSKQDHYDWGLRAIKSVLVVAGSLRRGDRERPEDQVLMRALRDFNTPKIVTDDLPVFMGLIGDLFPALDVPRKRDPEFEKLIKTAAIDLKLQPEDNFILKVVQLQELFDVRHSVFIVGNTGTGKSQIWKTLNKTYQNKKQKPVAIDLNPKAVTNDELFGIINPTTREWKDGLFSVIMRDLANMAHDGPKWIVLDGDIDPMWIESLNTVMDDNKVLTLASNERIPLTPSMRLLFEISHLRTATPATVSRAGILYINPGDLGWNPQVASWIDTREVQAERANLTILFDKYCPPCIEALKSRFKKITPIVESAHVHMLCNLLEVLLTPQNTPPDCAKELYELYFVWACVWAFGSALFQDQLADHRVEFSKWWVTEFKSIKFPNVGTVFDYFIDPETKKFEPWSKLVTKFVFDPDLPLQSVLVNTNETTRIRYFMDLLMEKGRPVMLVGNAGTGKTVLINDKLTQLSEDWLVVNVPFNFYTTSEMLQGVLEKPLEKKAGRVYGPPGTKRLVYFIDDMNMPEVDTYGTVQPHTLLRQHLDYKHWYDRQKLSLKDIHNCQYVSCMNPTAGSFTIDTRLQRHFAVFAVSFPGMDALQTIYNSILSQNLAQGFPQSLQKYSMNLVNGALALHLRITQSFLPTAIKFHYVFNLRDLSNIFQGILYAKPDAVKTTNDLIRLYIHEAERVYCDKLVDKEDIDLFYKLERETMKKTFEDMNEEECFRRPIVFCHFAQGVGDPKYNPVTSWPGLNKILVDALDNYNELNAAMNLVLFDDAMLHICRINRILESPRGNALLIGVGGSGKQSLSRLAASISSLEVFQITLRKGYSIQDLKVDLAQLYIKTGQKNLGMVFLMTDAQVANEKFLVLINDLLASGEIPGLFADDEREEIINSLRNEVKSMGIDDTKENCWKFFIDKVRRLLKVVLCFSPVGSTLRVRSRKFPAITNTTSIDWFHEWPEEALISVAQRFLGDVDLLSPSLQESVSQFMAFVHKSVNEMSVIYLQNDKRYNYTTPKSFLEQISLYKRLLTVKNKELQEKIVRLENGLIKLQSTSRQVDDLKDKLAAQEVEVKQKNEDADKLIKVVATETEKVTKEKLIADEEQKKVTEISIEVGKKQQDCEADLAKAEPALIAAQAALDTLDKTNLTEMKSFPNPPAAVLTVSAAVMCLLAPGGKVPKDRSWKAAKATMGNVDQFLNALKTYDKENIHENCRREAQVYCNDKEFEPELVKTKSYAASGLCSWVINILKFYEVYCDVAPKRMALQKANAELQAAKDKLAAVEKKVNELQAELKKLTDEFETATNAKLKCERDAQQTAYTISLANRLVGGLSSEKVRWSEAVSNFRIQEKSLPGNVLLTTAFVSYVGCFTKRYRVDLLQNFWMPFLGKLKNPIPITEGLDPLSLLIDDADIATWNNEGLPSDRMSTENATILTNCDRWPLMIDPQLQGIKWIKTRYGESLKVIRLGQKGYLDKIEAAISLGDVLLIENIEESIEAVLDPLLGRNTIKKGRAIKIGDKEVEYNPTFKLILHTKLANPHYKPEMQAQTTLINFTVTKDGLEDQLLADVVAKERPDLEKLKYELTRDQNEYKIKLKKLEDSLLAALSAAEGNFLGDTALVENLENTKSTAIGIEEKVKEAKVTSAKIDEARELYRPAAARASLLYFIMNDLSKIHPMYQFSLKAFKVVFAKAIERAEPAEEVKVRVVNLIDSITYSVFIYTTRGLFEKHKLIFTSQMVFLILAANKEIDTKELDFLLRFPVQVNVTTPVDFLNDYCWGGIKALSAMSEFNNLDRDIEGSAKRWKKFVESECPEKEKFPQEWKNKSALQKLCMMRALRPDRMLYALSQFVSEKLGGKYVENRAVEFSKSFEETTTSTPVFFILSPGVDPLKDVEALGKKLGFSSNNKNFHNISLGQGQEEVAEKAMEVAAKEGHWVVLQNVHLVAKWLSTLEKQLEQHGEAGHQNFRMFISAEPSADPAGHIIPQGILESAIKITNEPPTGMRANLHKALDNFNQDTLEMCAKETEFKSILFALCYFHAVVAERRKFGAQGWNRNYPFNVGDLTICVNVLYNYLEANNKVPWENLRYLFGEIMYGGHITDDWDRRLCRTYLEEYMNPLMFDGELNLAPGFPIPPSSDYKGYHAYIDDALPPESPYLYGLHPNAEIDFLTTTSESLFRIVLEMQPRDIGGAAGGEGGQTRDEKIKQKLDEILERLPDEFLVKELMAKAEEKTPYTVVAIQECERMNMLTREIRRSLKELNLGLKGELTITTDMEALQDALFLDQLPAGWMKRAYPSLYPLGQWYADLLLRIKELEIWTGDFQLPAAVWLGGLFNPQSFLTAIMQTTARKNEWPLDKMCLSVDVTKKTREELGGAPREGAYVHGMYMEGARWDTQTGQIGEAKLKDLTPVMPVVFIKAIPVDRRETKNIYECPVYKTKSRGPTFVWTFNLKTKEKAAKWVLGGVALLLQV